MKRRRRDEPLTLASLTATPSRREERVESEAAARATPHVDASFDDAINVAAYLRHAAAQTPQARALVAPRGRNGWQACSWAELDAETDRVAASLEALGLARGQVLGLLLPPSRELAVAVFAAWKAGAVPALAGPRLPLAALAAEKPAGLVGSAKTLAARLLHPRALPSVRFSVTTGAWLPAAMPFGAHSWDSLSRASAGARDLAPTRALDPALVVFTSPAHGEPRGIVLDHRAVIAQAEALRQLLGVPAGEPALATDSRLLVFALMLGASVVVPEIDEPAPKDADVMPVVEALDAHAATTVLGAPETWRRVAEACGRRTRTLPKVERVVLAGGAVPPQLHEWLKGVMPAAETLAIYGLAEALPLASLTGTESAGDVGSLTGRGAGLCLGRPLRGVDVGIVRQSDGPIAAWTASQSVAPGDVGELIVRAPTLAPAHAGFAPPDPMRDLASGDGAPFHRTGDLAWMDRQGRIWLVGRAEESIATRFGVLHPVALEGVLATHPFARRVAVVGLGASGGQEPLLVVEGPNARGPADDPERVRVQGQFLELAAGVPLTRRVARVLFHPGALPSDPAQASKIDRVGLAQWAQVQLGGLGATR